MKTPSDLSAELTTVETVQPPDAAEGMLIEPSKTRPRAGWRPTPRWAIEIACLAGVYYGVARLGLAAGALKGNVTPVWPPTGLSLAALLLYGFRLWPGVFAGAALVNGLSAVPFASALGMATGNTLEAVIGAFLLTRVVGGRPELTRVRHVLALVGMAAVVSTAVSATVGVSSLYLGGVLTGGEYGTTWGVWWAGDALGALVVAPLAMAWWRRPVRRGEWLEISAFAAVVAAATTLNVATQAARPYLMFPILIWAVMRLGPRGASFGSLAVSVSAVLVTVAGRGPFATGTPVHRLWVLDLYLAVVAVTGLLLAAVVEERDEASREVADLSRTLQNRVAELQVANAELEAFSYTVSHDLRAPLRNIDGFSRSLVKRYGDSLDDEAKRLLGVVRRNTTAMGELIDQLLAFSRLGRQELRAAPVAITEVVDEALATLVQTRADRNVHVMVAPGLPTVRGDRRLLTQVYVNLIDNALKFTRERDPALIEIGVHAPRDGRGSVLFVRDNGAGLDMRYVDKIFGVFQRLNRSEDYEGSGVGLAIVQRIVNRHGGSVWAEGEVGNGCTIYFTLGGSA